MFAVLELNDQLLQIRSESGEVYQETGFARLNADGIESGEVARESAWKEPQNSFNQYWCHLNQTTLAGKHKWARHHADIAFAQLKHLWQNAGEPDELMLLVPGSFDDSQLSLLLGMANALPSKILAVLDSALSACLKLGKETVFVELQLHQTVITHCELNNSTIRIVDQEIIPDLGMMQLLNRISRHISNLLIRSFRYDPLHASESEQYIYDNLPSWLGRLGWEEEISANLTTDQGELPFILSKLDVQNLMKERLGNMHSIIARYPQAQLVFSHDSRLLMGLFDEFSNAEVAAQSIAIDNGLFYQQLIFDQTAGLNRITSLSLGELGGDTTETQTSSLATHILCVDRAYPLNQPVSIHTDGKGIRLSRKTDDKAKLTVVMRNQNIELVHRAAGTEVNLPKACIAGEFITVGHHQLKLIEVLNG